MKNNELESLPAEFKEIEIADKADRIAVAKEQLKRSINTVYNHSLDYRAAKFAGNDTAADQSLQAAKQMIKMRDYYKQEIEAIEKE